MAKHRIFHGKYLFYAKFISFAVVLAILIQSTSLTAVNAMNQISVISDPLEWTYDSNECSLTILSGSMKDYGYDFHSERSDSPWSFLADEVKSITVKSGVENIGNYAFCNFQNVTTVKIADSVTRIGEASFKDCISLTKITLPKSLSTIESETFSGCSLLKSINIPENLTTIEDNAFKNCSSINTITLPNGFLSIGEAAFFACSALSLIVIPDSTSHIGPWAFSGCSSIESFTFSDNLNCIEDYVLYGCSKLETVKIGNNISNIGESAFYNCQKLSKIDIPSDIKSISKYAFFSCNNLSSVYYHGTEAQWNKITLQDDPFLSATVYFYCDGDHELDKGSIIVENSCLESGIVEYTCTKCHYRSAEIIPPHTDFLTHIETPATCTQDGNYKDVCPVCGNTVYEGTYDALGHVYNDLGICTLCGNKRGERIPGDADGDGEISSRDLKIMLQYIVGVIEFDKETFTIMDIDKDNEISAKDRKALVMLIVSA